MIKDNFEIYLQEKKSVHLNDDFDNTMMLLINKHALNASNDKKYFTFMYLFFFVGLLLGFCVAMALVDFEFFIGKNKFIVNKIILLIPLIAIFLFLFEKIYRATLVRIGKEKFLSI